MTRREKVGAVARFRFGGDPFRRDHAAARTARALVGDLSEPERTAFAAASTSKCSARVGSLSNILSTRVSVSSGAFLLLRGENLATRNLYPPSSAFRIATRHAVTTGTACKMRSVSP